MRDLRSRLERIGDRVQAAPDAFERLERARRRHERNRRIAAGTVALLVAIAGTVAAFTAFRTNDGQTVAGGGASDFFALWPEQTPADLAAAQEAVDSGDPDLAWRSDPNDVARRFALDVLQWPAVTVTTVGDAEPSAYRDLFIDLSIPSGSTCDRIVSDAVPTHSAGTAWSDPVCPLTPVTLKMTRLGRPDGLWSVVRVKSTNLTPPFREGEEVASGEEVVIPTFLREGTKVSMGVSFQTACGGGGADEDVEVTQGLLRFTVPGVPDACVGYVYAMTPETGVGAVAIGSFLFSDAPDRPAIGYLVDQIAAVPVLFTNTPAETSDVAEFTCDATGTIAPRSMTVDAQPDGVHVAVTNLADERISFTAGGSESTMYVVDQGGADPGEREEIVVGLPPGDAHVSCRLESAGGVDTSPMADLRVNDPMGSYVPIGIECRTSDNTSDYAGGSVGFKGDLVEIARRHLSGLEYDDSVEQVGYPDAEPSVVRVVRQGDVVALATFRSDGQGGWLIETVEACVDVPISWSKDVTGVSGPMGSTSPASAWDYLCSAARAAGPNTAHNGADLHVVGQDIAFDTRCLIAPAGEPLTIRFGNADPAIQRDISIYSMTPYLRERLVTGTLPSRDIGDPVFSGEFVAGPDEIVYRVGPLEPGEYYFQDDIHPSANGVLIVE